MFSFSTRRKKISKLAPYYRQATSLFDLFNFFGWTEFALIFNIKRSGLVPRCQFLVDDIDVSCHSVVQLSWPRTFRRQQTALRTSTLLTVVSSSKSPRRQLLARSLEEPKLPEVSITKSVEVEKAIQSLWSVWSQPTIAANSYWESKTVGTIPTNLYFSIPRAGDQALVWPILASYFNFLLDNPPMWIDSAVPSDNRDDDAKVAARRVLVVC